MSEIEDLVKISIKGNQTSLIPMFDGNHSLIPPPRLGSNDNVASVVKNLRVLTNNERYCLEVPDCTPLKHLLPYVQQAITSNKLNSRGAFLCLLAILRGDLHNLISQIMLDQGTFEEAWKRTQIASQGSYSRESCDKEIRKLLGTKPTSLSTTFTKLQLLYTKQYQYIQDQTTRDVFINTKIVEDIYKIINTYYSTSYSQIEYIMDRQRNCSGPDWDEVSALIEVATFYISKRQVSFGTENASSAPMQVYHQPSMAPMQLVPQQMQQAPIQTQQHHQPQQQQHQQQQPRQQSQRPSQPSSAGNSNPQKSNDSRGTRYTGNQQQQQQQQQQQPANVYHRDIVQSNCFKCNVAGHWARSCRTYSLPTIDRCCIYCQGHHQENCVTRSRNPANRGGGRGNQNQAPNSSFAATNPGPPIERRGTLENNTYVPKGVIGTGQQLPATAYMTPLAGAGANQTN